MYSSELFSRVSVAPGFTRETATTKLPPRVIHVFVPEASVSWGSIVSKQATDA
jgi:hypothetical protein